MALFGMGKKNVAEAMIRIGFDGKQAERGLNALQKSVKNIGPSIGKFATKFGPAAIAVAGLTLAVKSLGNAMKYVSEVSVGFEKSMSRLKAITGETGKTFDQLSDKSKQLGESTVFSATEVADAFTEMAKLGFKANDIIASSEGVLNLAALAQVDMATAAMSTVSVLNQFQLTADSSNAVVDIMAKSFTSSALDINKFSEAMKFVGPIANNANVGLEEITGALSILADNSIDSSMAGTGLRRMLIELSNDNSKASKALREMGSQSTTLTGKLKDLRDGGYGSVTKATELFGKFATTSAQIVIKNADSIDTMTESYKNASGAAEDMAKTMLDNVAGATKLLESAQEGLGIAIGEAFAGSKQERIELYADTISRATGFVKEHQGALKFLGQTITEIVSGTVRFGISVVDLIQALFRGAAAQATMMVSVAVGEVERLIQSVEVPLVEINKRFDKLVPDGLVDAISSARIAVGNFGDTTKIVAKDLAGEAFNDLRQAAMAMADIKDEAKGANSEMSKLTKKPDAGGGGGGSGGGDIEKEKTIALENAWGEKIEITKQGLNAIKEATNEIEDEMLEDAKARFEKKKELKELEKELLKKAEKETADAIAKTTVQYKDQMEMREKLSMDFASAFGDTLVMIGRASKASAAEQKALATIQAIINTSVAIGKTAATLGYPASIPFIALAAANGAAQVAMIQKQKFQTGGLVGSELTRSRQTDNVNALVGKGEYIMPAPQTSQNIELLESIRNNTANTASGISSGGKVINNFYGLSTEQVINIQKDNSRRSITGTKI